MATARVISGIQKPARPATAVELIAVGHQFCWEYRYPALKVVTANELHVPLSDPEHPTPTLITDSAHSIPRRVYTYEPGRTMDECQVPGKRIVRDHNEDSARKVEQDCGHIRYRSPT